MENLAPAGNPEALRAALAAGADAVYLGCEAFSARAGAGNFDAQALREAVTLCHFRRVRVYVTVNTLVKDVEIPALLEVLRLLDGLRVDAVLVQDLGVLGIVRALFPDLPVHASTQMAVHNASGARWCKRMGMRRVVLARECSLREIALCAAEGIGIEVFGHGAQCVSVSGECLFSSMAGERSGNRGRCAQPCRQTYVYRGRAGAWLSPRDLCLRDDLPALAGAGACSLKLEGRLKRPAYVAEVTGAYRRALDALAAGRFAPADAEEKRALLQAFQRGGMMRGYALGAEDAAVIEPGRVGHGGVPVGRIERARPGMAVLRLTLPLCDGDGLQLRGPDGDRDLIYAGPACAAGGAALLRLRPGLSARAGDEVVRLTDSVQEARAAGLTLAPVPADMTLRALPGEKLRLTVTDGESAAVAEGETVQAAQTRALTAEDAARSLRRTGDTPFAARDVSVETAGAFVPVSALNAVRRNALSRLRQSRADAFARAPGREGTLPVCALPRRRAADVTIVRTVAQAQAAAGTGALLALRPEDYREEALAAAVAALPAGSWLCLPTVCEEATLAYLAAFAAERRDRLGGLVLGSVGQLGRAWPLPFAAGPGIPVMNRYAAKLLLDAGCVFVAASPELTGRETEALAAGDAPVVVPAYGRVRLMLLHHCPARTYLGLARGHAACSLCDAGSPDALRGTVLRDPRGYDFPLLRVRLPEGCLVELLNALPTDNRARVRAAGLPMLIELTDEDGEDARCAAAPETAFPRRTTSGHWTRPVE